LDCIRGVIGQKVEAACAEQLHKGLVLGNEFGHGPWKVDDHDAVMKVLRVNCHKLKITRVHFEEALNAGRNRDRVGFVSIDVHDRLDSLGISQWRDSPITRTVSPLAER
jgi:hypothetical protein